MATKSALKSLLGAVEQQGAICYTHLALGLVNALLTVGQAALLAFALACWWQAGVAVAELWPYWGGFAALALLRAGALWQQQRLAFAAGVSLRRQVRALLLRRLAAAGPVALRRRSIGHWVSLVLQQVEALHDYYARYRPQQLLAMTVPVLFWLALVLVEPWVGLILLLTAPWIPLFMVLVGQHAARASRANQGALNALAGHFLNRLGALATLRLYRQAERQAKEVAVAADRLREETLKVLRIAFLSSAVLEFFTALSIALVAVFLGMSYLGYLAFSPLDGPLSLFVGLYLLLLVPEFFLPLRELGSAYHAKAEAEGAAELLLQTLEDLPSCPALEAAGERTAGADAAEQRPPVGVCCSGLEVRSPEGALLLDRLDFTLAPGETLLLSGSSGSGKTTLLETLLGFYPYKGVLCDQKGAALNTRAISWQGQELDLLAGSVRENLALGVDYSDQMLWQALAWVDLESWLRSLSAGLDLIVGEGGQKLSAGQRQRLLLARALLRPAELLLLDEPTAALDQAGAQALVERLQPLLAKRSCIIVSHRPELLPLAGRVLELEAGRLLTKSRELPEEVLG